MELPKFHCNILLPNGADKLLVRSTAEIHRPFGGHTVQVTPPLCIPGDPQLFHLSKGPMLTLFLGAEFTVLVINTVTSYEAVDVRRFSIWLMTFHQACIKILYYSFKQRKFIYFCTEIETQIQSTKILKAKQSVRCLTDCCLASNAAIFPLHKLSFKEFWPAIRHPHHEQVGVI